MVGPETHDPAPPGEDPATPELSPPRERARAPLAVAFVGVGVGAFFAALAGVHEHALQIGQRVPPQSWMCGWSLWLPVALLMFAAARLLADEPRLRDGLRWLSLAVAAAVAAAQLVAGEVLPWLAAPAAAVLGIAVGLSVGHVRLLPFWAVASLLLAGAAAAAGLVVVDANAALVAALGSGLLAVLLCADEHAYALPLRLRWWQLAALAAVGLAAVALARVPHGQPFLLATFVSLCLAARLARRDGVVLGASLAAVVGAWYHDPPVGLDEGRERLLARHRAADVVYCRADQELQLRRERDVLCAVGPDRLEQPLAIALSCALLRAGDRVLVFGSGGARIARVLREPDRFEVEVSPGYDDVSAVEHAIAGAGPVVVAPPSSAPDPAVCPLVRRREGSQQLVVLSEVPTTANAHRATPAFQRELRRVVGDGYLVQPIALDRAPVDVLRGLFAAAAAAHRWNGLYVLSSQSAALLSGPACPRWAERLRCADDATRWALHRAHLGGAEDLDEALYGTLRAPAEAGGVYDVPALLRAWSARPPVSPCPLGQSVLRRWAQRQDELERLRGRVLTCADDAAGRAEVQAMAARFLPCGAPAAWLQAALGLAGADGVSLRDPALASRCAHAIDPTFFATAPRVFAGLERPASERGVLEDLAALPPRARLAELCVGDGPLATALRARFPSRCAEALVAQLAAGPLATDAALALRQLADPFVLAEAARVLVPRGRWRELLGLWRGDLPMPVALQDVAAAGVEARLELAAAMRGRRDVSCHALLADLLTDDDLRLRRAAAELLHEAVGDLIPYDAEWPRSRRLDAAERLRALHNRKP